MTRLEDHFEHRPFKSKNVFLMDDEADMGWIFCKIIEDAGHKCIFASTFKEGLQKFKRMRNIDVAVIDLKLDIKDGLEFIREVRVVDNKPLFIMISAFGTPEIKEKAKKAGVVYFFDKPFKPESLLEIIEQGVSCK